MIKIEENLNEIYKARIYNSETVGKEVFLSRGHASGYVKEINTFKIETETFTFLIRKLNIRSSFIYNSLSEDCMNIMLSGKGGFNINDCFGIANSDLNLY